MKVNLKSISKDLNISVGTISRILNGKAKEYRISDATVERVTKYAQEVGYSPNLLAKSLQASKTFTIGLILPDIGNPFFSMMAKHIEKEASLENYSILLMDSDENVDKEKTALHQLSARKVDGIILCPIGTDKEHYNRILKELECPLVFVDRYLEGVEVPSISSNNYQGCYNATQLLIEKGHTTIALIQGDKAIKTVSERRRGYFDALNDHNISLRKELIIGNSFNETNGYESLQELMQLTEQPTALVCMSNQIGLGVLKAAKKIDLQLPQDLSIIAFDENPYAEFINPSLTTVKQYNDIMGVKAFQTIFNLIQDKKEVKSQQVETLLIVRDSIS